MEVTKPQGGIFRTKCENNCKRNEGAKNKGKRKTGV